MTGHERIREMLARRSELTLDEERSLQEHLQQCADCRDLSRVYAHQTALLRSLPLVEPPAALRAGVLTRVHETPPPRGWTWRPPSLALIAPFAVVLVVLVAALAYRNRPHGASNTALFPTRSTPTASGSTVIRSTPQIPPTVARPTAATPRYGAANHRQKPAIPPAQVPPPGPGAGSTEIAQLPPPTPVPSFVAPGGQVQRSTPAQSSLSPSTAHRQGTGKRRNRSGGNASSGGNTPSAKPTPPGAVYAPVRPTQVATPVSPVPHPTMAAPVIPTPRPTSTALPTPGSQTTPVGVAVATGKTTPTPPPMAPVVPPVPIATPSATSTP